MFFAKMYLYACSHRVVLKAANEEYLQLTGEKDAHITKTETSIRESESEIQQLRNAETKCVFKKLIPLSKYNIKIVQT